jgi:hypothetical protein
MSRTRPILPRNLTLTRALATARSPGRTRSKSDKVIPAKLFPQNQRSRKPVTLAKVKALTEESGA